MQIGQNPNLTPENLTGSNPGVSKSNRGLPAKIQGLPTSKPSAEMQSKPLSKRGSNIVHISNSQNPAAKIAIVASSHLGGTAPIAKGFSNESLKAAQETNWSAIEVTEAEANQYLKDSASLVLCRDSRVMMQASEAVKLSNGRVLFAGEHAALKFYSQHGYAFVNALLNNSPAALQRAASEMKITLNMPEMEKEVLVHCKMACSALNKLPASQKEELYRGAIVTPQQFAKYTEALAKNETLTELQILSTTTDVGVASRFVQIKQTRLNERYNKEVAEANKTGSPIPVKPDSISVLFAIKHEEAGKEIEKFSNAPDELEATFVAGTAFKVANILENSVLPVHMKSVYQHVVILQKV